MRRTGRGGSASRESEGKGWREGAEGSGFMGEEEGYTCTCMYWERRKKWLPVFLLLVPPPTHTCRYMYMYMVYLFFLFPHPPLYHLILPCTLPPSSLLLFFLPPPSPPPPNVCKGRANTDRRRLCYTSQAHCGGTCTCANVQLLSIVHLL